MKKRGYVELSEMNHTPGHISDEYGVTHYENELYETKLDDGNYLTVFEDTDGGYGWMLDTLPCQKSKQYAFDSQLDMIDMWPFPATAQEALDDFNSQYPNDRAARRDFIAGYMAGEPTTSRVRRGRVSEAPWRGLILAL